MGELSGSWEKGDTPVIIVRSIGKIEYDSWGNSTEYGEIVSQIGTKYKRLFNLKLIPSIIA